MKKSDLADRISKLEEHIARLEKLCESLAGRCHGQAEHMGILAGKDAAGTSSEFAGCLLQAHAEKVEKLKGRKGLEFVHGMLALNDVMQDAIARFKAKRGHGPETPAGPAEAANLHKVMMGEPGCYNLDPKDRASAKAGGEVPKHQLYKTGDNHIPRSIKDSNSEVVLSMCKVCGKQEGELEGPCETVAESRERRREDREGK